MLERTDDGAQRSGKAENERNGASTRGFASMDRERQREIASKGGRAAHAKGTAHEWTTEEARVAGRKGGEAVSRDREHMSAIGREGGGARRSGSMRAVSDQEADVQTGIEGQDANRSAPRGRGGFEESAVL